MPTQKEYDNLYIDIAHRIAEMSKARRLKVGAVVVKNDRIVSYGWNGTCSGEDNNCEHETKVNGELVTKEGVVHAELNALLKMIGSGVRDATMYMTHSPCMNCSRLIFQSNAIREIVYREEYRDDKGINWLRGKGVLVRKEKTQQF